LIRADLFEQVLQARYLGTKRFSLEGVTALIPLLDSILDTAGEHGAHESVMAMSHRGRLNVMVHAACKAPHEVVAGFEDVDPRSVLGAGDVKYHVGATGTYVTSAGKEIGIHLVSNPSHLEAVDPVAVGRVRAKQTRYGLRGPYVDRSPETLNRVVAIVMHGDAAFAGQGIWAETLNLADLKAYTVGGTIHIIVNNLIGFTTKPAEEHSSRFASDIAKRQSVPIFHVNDGNLPIIESRISRALTTLIMRSIPSSFTRNYEGYPPASFAYLRDFTFIRKSRSFSNSARKWPTASVLSILASPKRWPSAPCS